MVKRDQKGLELELWEQHRVDAKNLRDGQSCQTRGLYSSLLTSNILCDASCNCTPKRGVRNSWDGCGHVVRHTDRRGNTGSPSPYTRYVSVKIIILYTAFDKQSALLRHVQFMVNASLPILAGLILMQPSLCRMSKPALCIYATAPYLMWVTYASEAIGSYYNIAFPRVCSQTHFGKPVIEFSLLPASHSRRSPSMRSNIVSNI